MQGIMCNLLVDLGIFGVNMGVLLVIVVGVVWFGIQILGVFIWMVILGVGVMVVFVYVIGLLGCGGVIFLKLVLVGVVILVVFLLLVIVVVLMCGDIVGGIW